MGKWRKGRWEVVMGKCFWDCGNGEDRDGGGNLVWIKEFLWCVEGFREEEEVKRKNERENKMDEKDEREGGRR